MIKIESINDILYSDLSNYDKQIAIEKSLIEYELDFFNKNKFSLFNMIFIFSITSNKFIFIYFFMFLGIQRSKQKGTLIVIKL
jgi:hypothetical protein